MEVVELDGETRRYIKAERDRIKRLILPTLRAMERNDLRIEREIGIGYPCACGCGQLISDTYSGRRLYYSRLCRQKVYDRTKSQERTNETNPPE